MTGSVASQSNTRGPTIGDPAAAHRRARAEGHLIYVRWVLLAGWALHLLFSAKVEEPIWGWTAVLLGVVANGVLLLWRLRWPLSSPLSLLAQSTELLVLQLYIAALPGSPVRYLTFHTALLILATIRFGIKGAIGMSVVVLALAVATILGLPLLGGGTAVRDVGSALDPMVIVLAISVDAALLAYWAYLGKSQHDAHQQRERLLNERISELTVLHEVSSAAHDLKSEDALQNIVEIATGVIGFQRAALFLSNGAEGMMARRYWSHRASMQGERGPQIHMDPVLFTEVLRHSEPLVIDGSQGAVNMTYGPVVQIAVPLHGESPLGVLVADSPAERDRSGTHMQMLSSLAKSAVVAIENALLHDRIKQMANRDGLTQLYNHRYFQERLREMIGASGGDWPISLFMIEVDHFKGYNDSFGHRQGDTALYSLSRALEQSARRWEGLVARYGGDEFVVVLPKVGLGEALQVGKQMRDQVYRLLTQALARQGLPSVTLSIGVATFPVNAAAAGDLIEAADQAMYAAKQSGGDEVQAYSDSATILS